MTKLLSIVFLLSAGTLAAQKQELGLLLGGVLK